MNQTVNIILIVALSSFGILILLELAFRLLFGFGNPAIYIKDPQIGYLLAPNQQVRRFGNTISINQYSMRSPEINPIRPEKTLRVLMLGDSIINGGWWTDQANTISALVQQQLNLTEYPQAEILNASANSWAPRNQVAYLQRFGAFQAQIIILVINTDDLFGTIPSSAVVGRDRNYPDRKPPLALIEIWQRYLVPQPSPLEATPVEEGDRVGANLAAIEQIQIEAKQNQAKFLLLITPLLRELGQPGPRDYERKARQRLQDFGQARDIPLIDFLPIFNELPNSKSFYHDSIHLNQSGNQQVTRQICNQIQNMQI